ncbi:BON domain-containing protein [Psychroserpens sp. NJDZ02]|uniref:BON domain-containing protein n=1 Tax=Psychroserpens sp. NJDZ02 TaxID=2570561 RepID=UPI0010A7CF84|nr:BON domain-containing protein [Psychroserpens sp. NJDZ02]QCE40477.1 BON domain-containing protein [Psychroserpens sp. NJDZ02]
MKTDFELKNDILEELSWLPNIDETQIGVTVNNGIATLTGIVSDLPKKTAIEDAIKSLAGVKAVAEAIKVKYGSSDKQSDIEIAKAAINALEWNASVPSEDIIVEVEDGRVYLTGELEWPYQKSFAKRTIEHLYGVKEVVNNIHLKPKATPHNVEQLIQKAFKRSANIDAKNIKVAVNNQTLTLSGTVHSIKEKDDAEIAAYNAPGINNVINQLQVDYYPMYL